VACGAKNRDRRNKRNRLAEGLASSDLDYRVLARSVVDAFPEQARRARLFIAKEAIVVGPYNNNKLYANRCSDWLTKAFGLAWLYDRVVLALPDKAAFDDYRRRASHMTRTAQERLEGTSGASSVRETGIPRVEVVHIEVDPLTPEEHEALAQLAK
jgi:hypothetical protein